MAVLLNNGSVFLHIPKTGGSWVTRTLKDLGLFRCSIAHKHANWLHILAPGNQGIGRRLEYLGKRALFLRTRPRPFTFCFVRHPLAWYESFYAYKSQPKIAWELDGDFENLHRWHPNAVLNGLGQNRSFTEFVEAVLEKHPGYVSSLFAHYTFHPVDFVGRQECLREDLIRALELQGLKFDPEAVRASRKVNESNEHRERSTWDPDLRARVLAAERGALQRFGYAEE